MGGAIWYGIAYQEQARARSRNGFAEGALRGNRQRCRLHAPALGAAPAFVLVSELVECGAVR